MSRLRVADVDAVEQDGYLFAVAAAYAHVGLCSEWPSLAHIYSRYIFQQVVDTLYWRRLNVLAAQYSYHSRLLTQRQRRSRSHHVHLLKHHLSAAQGGVGGYLVGLNAHSCCRSVLQGCHTEYTDNHLSSQTCKQGIALVRELLKLQNTALVENWFVHK